MRARSGIARRLVPALWLLLGAGGCGHAPPFEPPSILLFVMDTTRTDAVSAYGRVSGTTPTLDRLATTGLRYDRAYAQASWTVPSHATLFTGLLPSQHGVTYQSDGRLPEVLVTLAERLRDAGYQTAGLSENVFVSAQFNFTQGFQRFARVSRERDGALVAELARWLPRLDASRPLFLFVNVMDPHAPYRVDAENPFLPAGATPSQAEGLPLKAVPYQCTAGDHPRELAILRGLYHANVRKADAKLAAVLELLAASPFQGPWISIVTSDHGEHFGERDLVGHGFSVRGPLVHVPLVVHGIPGVAPAVIDTPVQLADVVPTVLAWVGVDAPPELLGRPLPTRAGEAGPPRAIVAELSDPDGGPPRVQPGLNHRQWRAGRCDADDKVYGEMRALMRHPHKLIWFGRYAPELYDLDRDPEERRDLAASAPELVESLREDLDSYTADARRRWRAAHRAGLPAAPLSPEVVDELKALGYIADDDS